MTLIETGYAVVALGDQPVFTGLVALTVVVAVVDWWAVGTDRRSAEYVLKPLVMVVLIAATLSLDDPASSAARWWMVAGLVFSLAGDVFLMLDGAARGDGTVDLFVPGLASFLVGHVAYIVALWNLGVETAPFAVGIVLVLVLVALIGTRVIGGARAQDPRLGVPVGLYIGAISLMVASAVGTLIPAAIIGALLFYASDACIGWSRFVEGFRGARLWIMTTYHLGQVGLVLSLV